MPEENKQKIARKLILGIGNPDKEYGGTRHNIGKKIIGELACEFGISLKEKADFGAEIGLIKSGSEIRAIIANSMAYMNESGWTAKAIARFYKISPENIWIIHDDFDIILGSIRESFNSGSAGHNGVKSIIQELGTQKFNRIRVGIKPTEEIKIPLEEFVLNKFSPEEEELIKKGIEEAKKKIVALLNCYLNRLFILN